MKQIRLLKSQVPETVLRKTLYWVSESCGWTLEEESEHWAVDLSTEDPADVEQFHRVLNDFVLRAELDDRTRNLRVRIVSSALSRLASE